MEYPKDLFQFFQRLNLDKDEKEFGEINFYLMNTRLEMGTLQD